MLDNQKILELIRTKGPILPVQLAKEIDTNILLASAVLSDLVSQKKVFISHAKIGGSPLYYINGQEHKLQTLYEYLQEKEKKAYDLLKQKKILRDKILEPVIRVALRRIKDFAKPFTTEITGQKELFWKWYLLSNSEAELLLKQQFQPKPIQKQVSKKEEKKETQQKPIIISNKQKQDNFLNNITTFLNQNNIEIIEKKILKNNKEIELLVNIPSTIGKITYYCKAKNKKKITDSDISSAFVQAQLKKLPALFLTTGQLTKKAQQILNNELKGIIIKKI